MIKNMLMTSAIVTKITIFLKQSMLCTLYMQNLNVNTCFENLSATCLHYAFTCTIIQVLLSKMVVKIVMELFQHDNFYNKDIQPRIYIICFQKWWIHWLKE